MVEKDFIRIKTKTFCLWSIFACGGPKRKRATVFASRPDPRSDLIYLRFYIYSDNGDSKRVSDPLGGRNEGRVLKHAYMHSHPCTGHLYTRIDSLPSSLNIYAEMDEWVDRIDRIDSFFAFYGRNIANTTDYV